METPKILKTRCSQCKHLKIESRMGLMFSFDERRGCLKFEDGFGEPINVQQIRERGEECTHFEVKEVPKEAYNLRGKVST